MSNECTSPSDDVPAPSEIGARQKRRKPDGYSQTINAIASRKRQAELGPEERKKILERQANYAAVSRARKAVKNQEGFEDLSDAEQQKLLADEEARVTQERYVVVISMPISLSNVFIAPLETPFACRVLTDLTLGPPFIARPSSTHR
jgi:hypothetical protein